MQLVTKIIAAGTGVFVITGTIIGITIPLTRKRNNNFDSSKACTETNQCDYPKACEIVDGSGHCKCPSNELFFETEASDPTEKRCLKNCSSSDNCEAGTLCIESSLWTQRYCEDRDLITACSDAVKCTSDTECRLTSEKKIECLCKKELESTHIESTESGSTRTCKTSTCKDCDGCRRTELCLKDEYSKQGYCQERGNECPAEVVCTSTTTCKLNTDGFAECLCKSGYTEIEEDGLTATIRTCHAQTCSDSSGCGERHLCYQDGISKELYCADSSKGCDGAICPDETECFDANLEYAECRCTKGYSEISETTTDKTITCVEQTCTTSNDCKEKYLCYYDNLDTDPSGICSTRLKECSGVKCPTEANDCREAPSGFVECLCDEGQFTTVDATESGTERTCHVLTCTTSNDCDVTFLCYKDFITADFFCDATPTDCIPEVVCPDGFHCDDSGVQPECVCDADLTTQATQATRIRQMTADDGRNISERICYRSCENSDNCFPGTICFTDDSFISGYGCIEDRTPKAGKCSNVRCSDDTECLNENILADCVCKFDIPTIIIETDSGSSRDCRRDGTTCFSESYCTVEPKTVCVMDPYSLQGQCLEPSEIDSCDNVQCSNNSICRKDDNYKCGCRPEEDDRFNSHVCYTRCQNLEQCGMLGLGYCDTNNYCNLVRSR